MIISEKDFEYLKELVDRFAVSGGGSGGGSGSG